MDGNSLALAAEVLKRQIEEAKARRRSPPPRELQVVAVSKTVEPERVRAAHALGFSCFGENYVQEWQGKYSALIDLPIEWHFIGHLQSNKARFLVGQVALIHSLDRRSLAESIDKIALSQNIRQRVLIEVNVAEEASKAGCALKDVENLLRSCQPLAGIDLAGLMIMPPFSDQAENSRRFFVQAREWLEKWRQLVPGHSWNELSMGTSQDFLVAIEEGATLVRVGRTLFGERIKG